MNAPKQQQANSLHMIAVLGGVSLLSGFLIFFVAKATEAGIKESRAHQLSEAIIEVLPGAESSKTFYLEGDSFLPLDSNNPGAAEQKVYAGYDADGALIGLAIPAQAQGYANVIQALYGYDPIKQVAMGYKVLKSQETPGLGDKIGKDPLFLEQFDATSDDVLSMTLSGNGDALANPISFVKSGKRTDNWQIEGITGATISSKAVVTMLSESAEAMLPHIQKQENLDLFKKGGA